LGKKYHSEKAWSRGVVQKVKNKVKGEECKKSDSMGGYKRSLGEGWATAVRLVVCLSASNKKKKAQMLKIVIDPREAEKIKHNNRRGRGEKKNIEGTASQNGRQTSLRRREKNR